MIMHAPLDDIVELDNASQLFSAAMHPKSFVSLDKADHLLTREADSRYAGEVVAAWAARYLPPPEQTIVSGVPEGSVVARTETTGFRTDVQAGPHHLTADEPIDVGGTNLGPSPYGLLSAALASCTTMTLRMYATHKKLDLQSVSVSVTHEKIHAADCSDCETKAGKIDTFRRKLSFEGELSNEQRQRLAAIADRCPVHRTLHGEVEILTELE